MAAKARARAGRGDRPCARARRRARWAWLLLVLGAWAAAGCDATDEPSYPLATFVCAHPIVVGEDALFDAGASRDNGLIQRYAWLFADGSPVQVSPSPQIRHRFDAPGTYSVELEVSDERGWISWERREVVVAEAATPCGPGAPCAGGLRCEDERCMLLPAECRAPAYGEPDDYPCPEGEVCCNRRCAEDC